MLGIGSTLHTALVCDRRLCILKYIHVTSSRRTVCLESLQTFDWRWRTPTAAPKAFCRAFANTEIQRIPSWLKTSVY
jgi:hypothetical protein